MNPNFFPFIILLLSNPTGPQFYAQEYNGFKYREIVMAAIFFVGFLTVLSILSRIYAHKGFAGVKAALKNTAFTFFIHGVFAYIFFFSPSNIGGTQTRFLMYISGLNWGKSCVKYMKFLIIVIVITDIYFFLAVNPTNVLRF